MPPRAPDLTDLLALLERYLHPVGVGFPGGTATQRDLSLMEKDCPVKGELIAPGPWPLLPSPPPPPQPSPSPPPSKRELSLAEKDYSVKEELIAPGPILGHSSPPWAVGIVRPVSFLDILVRGFCVLASPLL
ncbi:hypothetical protein DER45DRAFT_532970 [Fusarium avenaceum]|nr:hypothetical protein DER45DRAFT_532970 [Fusarium avenaceum]